MDSLEQFIAGYVEAALWSTSDESDERGGVPLDENYSAGDLSDETRAKVEADCRRFLAENEADIALYVTHLVRRTSDPIMAYAGHDFWLTRNGHGCGFWDRGGVGECGMPRGPEGLGKRLTDASKRFGECYLYVGDDGKIYG